MQTFVSFGVSVDEKSAEWRYLVLYGLQRAFILMLRSLPFRSLLLTFTTLSKSTSDMQKYAKDEELVKCSRCGRFYHLDDECTGEYCGRTKRRIVCLNLFAVLIFVTLAGENPHTKCFRCVIAYHQECRPPDVHDLDDRYFVCIKHIQADQKKKDEEVEEKEMGARNNRNPTPFNTKEKKVRFHARLFILSRYYVIGVMSNTKNIELVEEGEDYSVSGGIDDSVLKDKNPQCMKSNENFNVEWSHKQCIFVVIDAEVHIEREDQITEYRHKRGFCSRKRLRKCK